MRTSIDVGARYKYNAFIYKCVYKYIYSTKSSELYQHAFFFIDLLSKILFVYKHCIF